MTTDPERWRTLSTDDGCPIAVRESGRANGLAFLLVHALAMDASPWDGVARELVAEGNPGISPRSGSPDSSPDRSENRFADR